MRGVINIVIISFKMVFLSNEKVLLNLFLCLMSVKVIFSNLGRNNSVVVFYIVIIIMFWCVIC